MQNPGTWEFDPCIRQQGQSYFEWQPKVEIRHKEIQISGFQDGAKSVAEDASVALPLRQSPLMHYSAVTRSSFQKGLNPSYYRLDAPEDCYIRSSGLAL